jgi:hypothetical protein
MFRGPQHPHDGEMVWESLAEPVVPGERGNARSEKPATVTVTGSIGVEVGAYCPPCIAIICSSAALPLASDLSMSLSAKTSMVEDPPNGKPDMSASNSS